MYKITFEDNTVFYGGQPQNSKWNEIPDKKIIQIDYQLGNKRIIMKDYDGYNHIVKHAQIFNHGQCIYQIILMGKENDKVTKIVFDIKKHTVVREYSVLGREINGALSTGWKKGVDNKIGIFNLFVKNQ